MLVAANITTETQYREALDRVDSILTDIEGDPEADSEEFESLIDAIEIYEKIHYPMSPSKSPMDDTRTAAHLNDLAVQLGLGNDMLKLW